MHEKKIGAHQWIIEFKTPPEDLIVFTHILDGELKAVNSDYEAKRSGNLSLGMPQILAAKSGLFENWLKSINKLGGQHKVPRLNNDRELLEVLLKMNAQKEQN
jgi:hypothetical protein